MDGGLKILASKKRLLVAVVSARALGLYGNGVEPSRRGKPMKRVVGSIFAAGALITGLAGALAPAAFAQGASYTVEAGDHGPGGWAGGSLFADGTAVGSGEIAGPETGGPMQITLTTWAPDNTPGYLDVNYVFGPGLPGCVVVPITHGAMQPSPLFVGPCNSGVQIDTLPGKATPTR